MRLAVFTNQFPGRYSTFFSRDIRGLLESGLDIDVFAIYPYKTKLWRYVPEILNEKYIPKDRLHHSNPLRTFWSTKPWPPAKFAVFLADSAAVTLSAIKFGISPLAKSLYVLSQAWAWAREYANYDHLLAYWANYSATCAYAFHRLLRQLIPFSIYPHAGVDLYENQVFLRQKLLYADNIIVDCNFNKEYIRQLYPDLSGQLTDKIYVYHPGVDLNEFSYQPDGKSSRKVVAVGRLEKAKGFDYLLQAVHQLKVRGLEPEIELVGDGVEENSLRLLAEELGIQSNIKFRGWVTPDEAREAIRKATLLAHPSPYIGDAVPNVIKEAMALGTPVVASAVAGIPELLDGGRSGMLVPPRDARALANAIQVLLTNDSERTQYAQRGREYAEQTFNLWRNGKNLADLLRSSRRSENRLEKQ